MLNSLAHQKVRTTITSIQKLATEKSGLLDKAIMIMFM